jgi:hypothetical protein
MKERPGLPAPPPRSKPQPRAQDLDFDVTQQIDAPLADRLRRDEPTLSSIEYDDLDGELGLPTH